VRNVPVELGIRHINIAELIAESTAERAAVVVELTLIDNSTALEDSNSAAATSASVIGNVMLEQRILE